MQAAAVEVVSRSQAALAVQAAVDAVLMDQIQRHNLPLQEQTTQAAVVAAAALKTTRLPSKTAKQADLGL
jgi:nicotinate-nucleotide pyrophosphorylase